MHEQLIDIHVPVRKDFDTPDFEHVDPGLSTWGRADLAVALQDRGAEVTFSRGQRSYDMEHGTVSLLRPRLERTDDGYAVQVTPQTVALDSIGAIRNITKAIGHDVPELNHPDVRTLAFDKLRANAMLATVGLAKEHAALSAGGAIEPALDAITSDQVIIKPRKGMKSKNLHIGSKADIARLHAEGGIDPSADWLIEELLDFSPELPLTGLDAEQDVRIRAANEAGAPKELRTYYFGRDPAGRPLRSFVMRAALAGDEFVGRNDWIYIDPDSVPQDIIDSSDTVFTAVERHTGVSEVHLAIDAVRALRQNGESVTLPMEFNASEPQLVYSHENQLLARQQAGLLADQLIRVANTVAGR